MVFGLDRPISVICGSSPRDLTTSQNRPLQLTNASIMAASRLPSSHSRTRIRTRQSLEERISRKATTSDRPSASTVNGVDSELEKLMISRRQRNFKLEEFEILNTLGTGTFGRVVLTKHKVTKEYYALKILTISEIIRLKQVEHVRSEKAILKNVAHPFIVDMLWTYHNDRFLYMLLEFICGGELFSYLRNAGRFNNTTSNFYAAEIVSALDYLHSKSIVYRDLKPENLLLDREGHLKITDFGFAKFLRDRTWTLCGTPEYLAPEIIQSKGHNKAVDWWALGILIYEMMVGYPPFYDDKPFGIYEKILAGKIEWPKHMDPVAKDLIRKLLVQDRTKRLGNMKNGAEDVKNHKWFRLLRWDAVYGRKLVPPIVPRVRHRGDTRNFFDYPETNWQNFVQPPIVPPPTKDGETKNFDEYSENNWHIAKPAAPHEVALFNDF